MVTHTVKLTLSPTQVKRRQNILAATREIISAEGSDNLSMQDVADKAGIARATIYRYYARKEDLITDMALDWGLSLFDRLQKTIPSGNTVGERVTTIFEGVFTEAQENLNLISATLSVLTSPDYTMFVSHEEVEQLLPSLLSMVTNDGGVFGKEFTLGTLTRLMLANLFYISSGRSDVKEATEYMAYVASMLYGQDVWDQRLTRIPT